MTRRLAAALLILALALLPGRAAAHAALIRAEPADGAVVEQAPARLALHFNEPVLPLVLRLIRPDGSAADLTAFAARGEAIEIEPPHDMPAGPYLLSWRVTSADGHPIGGSVAFSVGGASAAAMPGAPETDAKVRLAIWLARVFLLIGLFIGAGGAVFSAWIATDRTLHGPARVAIFAAIGLGLLGATSFVGLQGLDAVAAPLGALTHAAVWAIGLEIASGPAALVAILALLCGLLAVLASPIGLARVLAALALAGAATALAWSGHAASAEPQWLTRPAVFLHAAGLVVWLGALVPLLTMLRAGAVAGAETVSRFSRLILPIVLALLAAGVVLAVIQLETIEALWTTAYGVILSLKLVAVLGLLALAAVNRLRFTPALSSGSRKVAHRFAQSISAELVLAIVILGLVAGWRFTPPPRAAISAPRSETAHVHIHAERGMADLSLDPGRTGSASAAVKLFSPAGAPLEAREVTLILSNPAAGIEPLTRPGHRTGPGAWSVDDLPVLVPGRWNVRIDALVSDFDKLILEGTVEVGR
jgi:copper transport protein